jgi:hypothetical protein
LGSTRHGELSGTLCGEPHARPARLVRDSSRRIIDCAVSTREYQNINRRDSASRATRTALPHASELGGNTANLTGRAISESARRALTDPLLKAGRRQPLSTKSWALHPVRASFRAELGFRGSECARHGSPSARSLATSRQVTKVRITLRGRSAVQMRRRPLCRRAVIDLLTWHVHNPI